TRPRRDFTSAPEVGGDPAEFGRDADADARDVHRLDHLVQRAAERVEADGGDSLAPDRVTSPLRDGARVFELDDLVPVVAELEEHFLGVLGELGWSRARRPRRAAEVRWRGNPEHR